MSKANVFAALIKEARGHGVAETDKQSSVVQRIRGKRDNSEYGKIGVYIRNETIAEVKARLIREKRDLSDLVQQLLDRWIERQNAG